MEKTKDLAKTPTVIYDMYGDELEVTSNNSNHPEIWY